MPPGDVPAQVPVGYLVMAIGGLVGGIGVLFWQLIAAKNAAIDLAREVIPVATQLVTTAQNLQRLVDRLEREGKVP